MQVLTIGCMLNIRHFGQYGAILSFNNPVISDLTTHFGIKRRFVKNQLGLPGADFILKLIIHNNRL